MSDRSLAYYEREAQAYAAQTFAVSMQSLVDEFLALLPDGSEPAHISKPAHILDVGCGSGRDAVSFLQRGYAVTALDGSAALCRIANKQLQQAWQSMRNGGSNTAKQAETTATTLEGKDSTKDTKDIITRAYPSAPPPFEVVHKQFLDINYIEQFEGIWACASLLHCSAQSLPTVLKKLSQALKPDGVLYVSFKYGDQYRQEGERDFLDLNEERFSHFFAPLGELQLHRLWRSHDQRVQNPTIWLNALLRKKQQT